MKSRILDVLRSFSPSKMWKRRSEARAHRANIKEILASGLFHEKYYVDTYPDIKKYSGAPVVHFYFDGGKEGRRPNPYFDSKWYLQTNRDVAISKIHPLLHYVRYGEGEGRAPCPIFDPLWYRDNYPQSQRGGKTALSHYLGAGASIRASPSKHFDVSYYLSQYPDVALSGMDPFLHYLHQGHTEGRKPNANFDTHYYREKYCNDSLQNPLLHYIEHGLKNGWPTQPREAEMPSVGGEHAYYTKPHPSLFVEHDPGIIKFRKTQVRLIAFYLPQFHSIPENDSWWGKGFTEWNSVTRGLPRFVGHYQPRIPRDLGFYDLSLHGPLERQVELARSSGIEGFCFYFYWFDGRRLLERPLENFLNAREIDFPYCVMWANENWTRTWDGLEKDVLIAQTYKEDDEAALLDEFADLFADRRYIRIGDRPLLIVYRPGLIPNARATIAGWRQYLLREHDATPFICMVQGFGDEDPLEFGLDGAVEFPPHKLATNLERANKSVRVVDSGFAGNVHRYDDLVARALAVEPPKFPLIRTVVPSWDNEARRPGRGTTFSGSTPAKYEDWLRRSIAFARKHPVNGESMVFVNAWNEWGEGAYLEPDVHFGSAYLNATARAVANRASHSKMNAVLFGHDCALHGAQLLLLNIAKTLTRQFGIEVVIVVAGGGPLLPRYKEVAEVRLCTPDAASLQTCISGLYQSGYHYALTNTTVSGWAVPILKTAGMRVVSLVHELPRLIEVYKLSGETEAITKSADRIVFASEFVRRAFETASDTSIADDQAVILPQGVYNEWKVDSSAVDEFRKALGLGPHDKLIINVGYADLRKGIDIFLAVAKFLIERRPDVHFAWIGHTETATMDWLADDLKEPELKRRIHLVGQMEDPVPAYEGADAFFLSSREDPFPTVILEAFRAGLPVVALKDGGGYEELVRSHGLLASRTSIIDIASHLEAALDQSDEHKRCEAAKLRALIRQEFHFPDYVAKLVNLLEPTVSRVSVIVPNYNYAEYLPERLDSIYAQTMPLYEVIVMDDKSTDESMEVIAEYLASTKRVAQLLRNDVNSGSGYLQWRKGLEEARGEYVWIAEADDVADPQFLEEALSLAAASGAAFVFTDSAQLDSQGRAIGDSYGFYFAKVDSTQFRSTFTMEGKEFARRFLSVRNVILNVSGVLWRREALMQAFGDAQEHLGEFKLATDWLLYFLAALRSDQIGYVAKPLNQHRRHQTSVTHALAKEAHLAEIMRVHAFVRQHIEVDQALENSTREYVAELADQFEVAMPPAVHSQREPRHI